MVCKPSLTGKPEVPPRSPPYLAVLGRCALLPPLSPAHSDRRFSSAQNPAMGCSDPLIPVERSVVSSQTLEMGVSVRDGCNLSAMSVQFRCMIDLRR